VTENKQDIEDSAIDSEGNSVVLVDDISNAVCPAVGCIYAPHINVQPSG
jgi:hypothetical protein